MTYDNTRLLELIREVPDRVQAWLDGVTQAVTDDVKLEFGSGPGGITYRRGGRAHTASQPGYPPNVDLGALRAGIHWRKEGPLQNLIEDSVIYGLPLEIGTSRIRPRPFMRPVFKRWEAKIWQDLAEKLLK